MLSEQEAFQNWSSNPSSREAYDEWRRALRGEARAVAQESAPPLSVPVRGDEEELEPEQPETVVADLMEEAQVTDEVAYPSETIPVDDDSEIYPVPPEFWNHETGKFVSGAAGKWTALLRKQSLAGDEVATATLLHYGWKLP